MAATESSVILEDDPFSNIFERYEKFEQQELVIHQLTNWNTLLSQECKFSTDPVFGLVESKTDCFNGSECIVLMPFDESFPEPYDMRDFHTILKDLTCGIFAFNQPPYITLEPNYDLTSNCSFPPAYLDTLTGRLLVEFDYWIKSLWHGVSMDREARMRVMDKWRELENEVSPENTDLLVESAGDGLIDLAKDPLYAEHYSKLPVEHPLDEEMAEDRHLFESWLESISLRLIMMPGAFQHSGNILVCQSVDHVLDTMIRAMDDEISTTEYQKIFVRLSHHRDIISQSMAKKTSWARMLSLLKLVSVLTVVIQAARNQRARIPAMSNLFCHLQGEATKTERELPPVIIPKTSASRTFMSSRMASKSGICAHLHGAIGFAVDTGDVTKTEDMREDFIDELVQEAHRVTELFTNESKRPTQQRYPVPTVKFKGKRYHVLHIRFDEYFPPPNTKPAWLAHLIDEINRRAKDKDNNQKKLMVADIVMHDTFKRVFGYARAIKCKEELEAQSGSNNDVGFQSALQRGLLAIFYTLLKRVQTARLSAQNEHGYALLHLAAIYNRINMAAALISLGMDFNAKRGAYSTANGPTALHLAARAGSLEVVSCLSCLGGEYSNCITSVDQFGWTAIHHAAYFDHVAILVMLLRRLESAGKPVVELETSDDLKHTPLLLTARSGALVCMQQLISMGAARNRFDKKENGIVELAVLHYHTRILEWLIGQNYTDVQVFQNLSRMLQVADADKGDPDHINRAAAAARCIDILTAKNLQYWQQLLDSGAVAGLVSWLILPPEVAEAAAARRKQQRGRFRGSANRQISSASSDLSDSEGSIQRQSSETLAQGGDGTTTRPGALSSALTARRLQARQAKLSTALSGLISASVSALCNIGSEPVIRNELARLGAGQRLSELLIVPDTNIQARAATVLGDVCSEPEQQCRLADVAFRNIVPLLYESSEDVLVAAVNALRFLVTGNAINQSRIASYSVEAVQAVVDFLSVAESNSLRGASAACIAALAAGHADNQSLLLDLNAAPPLVALLKARNVSVAVRAAAAVAAMAADNPRCQQRLFELDAAKPLVRVLKMVFVPLGTTSDDESDERNNPNRTQEISAWSLEVKEQTMTALWALAGHTVAQRRRVAELISLQTLVELLITESDPLRRHSAFAVAAFCREDRARQMEVFRCNAVQPMLRLIRAYHKVSEETLVLLVEALGALCYLPAFTANEAAQRKLFEEGAFKDLLRLLIANSPPANTQLVRVTILKTLSLMTLSNAELRNTLFNSLGFKLEPLLSLVSNLAEDPVIRLSACQALATFSLHNSPLQLRISELGGLRYEVFAPFLNAAGWNERCQAAFQIVLLSRIVSDADQVALTAAGVLVLVQALAIEGDCNLLTAGCNLIGTLCHARAGVADAFISAEVLKPLIFHLCNDGEELEPSRQQQGNKPPTLNQQTVNAMNDALGGKAADSSSSSLIEEVQQSAAIALSFITRNRTARRLLLSECRKFPEVYTRLSRLAGNAGFKFDDEFEAEYAAIAVHHIQSGRTTSTSRSMSRASSNIFGGDHTARPHYSAEMSPPMARPKTAASSKQSNPSAPPSALRSSLSTAASERSRKKSGVVVTISQS